MGVGQQAAPTSEASEQWARVKALFLQALDLPESARPAFLDQACGAEPALRREVESLLASHAAAGDFGETPAAAMLPPLTDQSNTRRLEPGARLGAYEVTDFIAAGGMGEVYRARHTVLGRDVAIKILPSNQSDEASARRLIREARNAAVLSHPAICTIHEIGESPDGPFIVMEYVPGRLLSDLLRDGVPTPDAALRYGIQIAEALSHAHQHGIVHRDLKSSNIIITGDDRPVILDFGLAKRLAGGDEAYETTLTAAHVLAGTLSHMAPEVLLGGQPDVRSDVWALGVVLYELVNGELPFQGRTAYETSSAILENQPRRSRKSVPLALRLVIERCLMKEPAARYQHAADVHAALDAIRRRRSWPLVGPLLIAARPRQLRVAAALVLLVPALLFGGLWVRNMIAHDPPISSIAVLPIGNATGDARAQYYADGFTEGLITQLGTVVEARIIPRTSVLSAFAQTSSRAQIARRLNADVIVEGTLRRADERVVIDLKLTDPARTRVLWSETHERDSREVLVLQADLVRALALAVRLAMRPDAVDRLALVRTVSPAAYEEYLKGRYQWNQRTPTSLRTAVTHFTRATELDPTYAPAYAALADCYNQLGTVMVSGGSPREWRPRAAAAAIKALQLDPYLADAHAALGYVRHYQWQWAEAERAFRRALELNPNSPLARTWYANLLMSRGRFTEALEQLRSAQTLDPFSLVVNTNVGWTLIVAGRLEEAIAQLRRTLELDSTYVQARQRLTSALSLAGHTQEALQRAERLVVQTDSANYSLVILAHVAARAGRSGHARALLARMHERAQRAYVPPWSFVHPYVALGEFDRAADYTEQAFQEGSNGIAYLFADAELAPLRQHPRVRTILTRAGFD